jgi:rhomboid protease GluP|nr:rhomboid family intramembrane serine protease [Kofleriaceae bacterium]
MADDPKPTPPKPAAFPWATVVVVATMLGVFALELSRGLDMSSDANNAELARSLGGNYVRLTLGGDWWRLVTSLFVHYKITTLAMTAVCLIQVRGVERVFGRLGYAVLFLAGGLVGGAASVAHLPPNMVVVGAAGGLFALYGAMVVFWLAVRDGLDDVTWKRGLRNMGVFLAINLAFSLAATHADAAPFFVGLAVGAAIGSLLLFRVRTSRARTIRAVAALAGALAITAGVLLAVPQPAAPSAYAKLGPTGALLDELVAADHALGQHLKLLPPPGSDRAELATAADRVDLELAPPLVALRARLAAAAIPDAQRTVFDAALRHLDAEIHLCGVMSHSLRDPAWGAAHHDAFEADRVEALSAVKIMAAEVKKL